MTRVGLLFPGEMGAAVGGAVRGEVLWASDGRSEVTPLTAQAHAIARAHGVEEWLEAEGVTADRLPRVVDRAWRWAPEMEEIAEGCAEIELSDAISRGAAEFYRRLAEAQ